MRFPFRSVSCRYFTIFFFFVWHCELQKSVAEETPAALSSTNSPSENLLPKWSTQWSLISVSPSSDRNYRSSNSFDEMFIRSITLPKSELKGDLIYQNKNQELLRQLVCGATAGLKRVWGSTEEKNTSLIDPSLWIKMASPFSLGNVSVSGKFSTQFPVSPTSRDHYYRLRTGLHLIAGTRLGNGMELESGPTAFFLTFGTQIQYRVRTYEGFGVPWYLDLQPKLEWRTSGPSSLFLEMIYRNLSGENAPKSKELDSSISIQSRWNSKWSTKLSFTTLLETEAGPLKPLKENWISALIDYQF